MNRVEEADVVVIGGGIVGASVAYGLACKGRSVLLLDEGDEAFRAARGNFGLVWVRGKGLGAPNYARWTMRSTLHELDRITDEFQDRFGEPPEPVRNLLYQVKVRLLAEHAGLVSVASENGQLVLRYADGNIPPRLTDVGPWVRVGRTALWMPYPNIPDWRQALLDALEKLGSFAADALAVQPTGLADGA